MSVCATHWAWKKQVGGGAKKLVLLSMADRAGENFTCFPSITRLMADTELSRSAVIKAIGDLEKMGVIAFTGKTVGNGVKVYRLVGVTGRDEPVQNLDRPKSAPVQNIDPTRPDSAPPPVQNIDPTRPDSAPLTIKEPSIEPSLNHQSFYAHENPDCQNPQAEPTPKTSDVGKASSATETWFDEFWQAYPVKKSKGQARTSFFKLMKKSQDPQALFAQIMAGLSQNMDYLQRKIAEGYPRYPSTWLNAESWLDEPIQQAPVNNFAQYADMYPADFYSRNDPNPAILPPAQGAVIDGVIA